MYPDSAGQRFREQWEKRWDKGASAPTASLLDDPDDVHPWTAWARRGVSDRKPGPGNDLDINRIYDRDRNARSRSDLWLAWGPHGGTHPKAVADCRKCIELGRFGGPVQKPKKAVAERTHLPPRPPDPPADRHPFSPKLDPVELLREPVRKRCACRGDVEVPQNVEPERLAYYVQAHQESFPHSKWDRARWVRKHTAQVDVPIAVLRKVG